MDTSMSFDTRSISISHFYETNEKLGGSSLDSQLFSESKGRFSSMLRSKQRIESFDEYLKRIKENEVSTSRLQKYTSCRGEEEEGEESSGKIICTLPLQLPLQGSFRCLDHKLKVEEIRKEIEIEDKQHASNKATVVPFEILCESKIQRENTDPNSVSSQSLVSHGASTPFSGPESTPQSNGESSNQARMSRQSSTGKECVSKEKENTPLNMKKEYEVKDSGELLSLVHNRVHNFGGILDSQCLMEGSTQVQDTINDIEEYDDDIEAPYNASNLSGRKGSSLTPPMPYKNTTLRLRAKNPHPIPRALISLTRSSASSKDKASPYDLSLDLFPKPQKETPPVSPGEFCAECNRVTPEGGRTHISPTLSKILSETEVDVGSNRGSAGSKRVSNHSGSKRVSTHSGSENNSSSKRSKEGSSNSNSNSNSKGNSSIKEEEKFIIAPGESPSRSPITEEENTIVENEDTCIELVGESLLGTTSKYAGTGRLCITGGGIISIPEVEGEGLGTQEDEEEEDEEDVPPVLARGRASDCSYPPFEEGSIDIEERPKCLELPLSLQGPLDKTGGSSGVVITSAPNSSSSMEMERERECYALEGSLLPHMSENSPKLIQRGGNFEEPRYMGMVGEGEEIYETRGEIHEIHEIHETYERYERYETPVYERERHSNPKDKHTMSPRAGSPSTCRSQVRQSPMSSPPSRLPFESPAQSMDGGESQRSANSPETPASGVQEIKKIVLGIGQYLNKSLSDIEEEPNMEDVLEGTGKIDTNRYEFEGGIRSECSENPLEYVTTLQVDPNVSEHMDFSSEQVHKNQTPSPNSIMFCLNHSLNNSPHQRERDTPKQDPKPHTQQISNLDCSSLVYLKPDNDNSMLSTERSIKNLNYSQENSYITPLFLQSFLPQKIHKDNHNPRPHSTSYSSFDVQSFTTFHSTPTQV